jgi:hypothetical protein
VNTAAEAGDISSWQYPVHATVSNQHNSAATVLNLQSLLVFALCPEKIRNIFLKCSSQCFQRLISAVLVPVGCEKRRPSIASSQVP